MTGFFTISRGSSFLNESAMAGIRIFGSVIVAVTDRLDFDTGDIYLGPQSSKGLAGRHREMLDNGS
jgi:hypothetical protein